MKLGYLIPTRERVMGGSHGTAEFVRLAQVAEDLGFDSLWVGDSLVAKPRHEPLMVLAGLASVTRTASLGTAVLLPGLRNPVLLAQQAATLDQLADGRLILGVGIAADSAANKAEFLAAGVPFDKRVGRLLEGMDLCRALWSGEAVDWDGRWQLSGVRLGPEPVQKNGPPIWMAGTVPAARERLARRFDGWFPTGPNDPAQWREILDDIRARADAHGRDGAGITGAAYLTVAIDDDPDVAMANIDDYLQRYYGVPGSVVRQRQACFGGTLDDAMAWLAGFSAAGLEHAVLRVVGDPEQVLPAIARARDDIA
jgi:alkanesulfonate monooxygenase SsuD/methylene tetrahydromethanopterin reductase-like flavin-dependent oxidoreductase (luciferase family)